MAESGLFERYGIDRIYGLHVMPRLTVGQVETRLGTLNASTD
jgi:metal-dependent amidase/aminoacylase/carboxypeptidase family protein